MFQINRNIFIQSQEQDNNTGDKLVLALCLCFLAIYPFLPV